ncbi:MAG TPA: ABC transporter permease [Bryobacteraceae bacterium]|nr:ABC transporter permease [Bryobacteraceae bacterium]
MPWLTRFANLFRPNELYREIDQELEFHLEARVADNLAAGMTPEDARRDAILRFGGRARVMEQSRDADVVLWIESIAQDLRYAWRSLRRTPVVTAVALGSLVLAIAANTAIFSVVNAVLLRALPYPDAGRLAIIWSTSTLNGSQEINTSFPNFADWKSRNRSFTDLAAYRPDAAPLYLGQDQIDEPEWVDYTWTHGDLFGVLGRTAAVGRVFAGTGETGVAVISHSLWKRRFDGSPAAIGQKLRVGGTDLEIIGVMPEDFNFPAKETALWVPAASLPNFAQRRSQRDGGFGTVIGRLQRNASFESARAELEVIAHQLSQQFPREDGERGVNLLPLSAQVHGKTVPYMLLLLFGAVGFVLLIACTNVANLLLARGAVRSAEVALRTALGAGRFRIIRQLLTESIFLSLAAGVLSLPLAAWVIRSLIAIAPAGIARLDEAQLDPRVLAFGLGLSLFTGALFGLAPALRISKPSGSRGATHGPHSQTLRRALVVAEFALAVVLLTGAGLLLRSFAAVESVDPGFDRQHVVAATLRFRSAIPRETRAALYREAIRRIGMVPGVSAAGAINTIFYVGNRSSFGLRAVEGRAAESHDQWAPMSWNTIAGGYFEAMGVPLLQGRLFTERDTADVSPVVVINETMAKRYWPGEDPIGKGIKGFDPRGRSDEWVRVIGVVKDMHTRGLEYAPMAQIYEAQAQSLDETQNIVVRSQTGVGPIREVIRNLDKTAVWSDVSTLDQKLREQGAPRRFQTLLLSLFAAMALVLAGVGIFGMMHYSVIQRTREIGVRMAMGARSLSVVGMIVREAMMLVAAGLGCGLAASFGLTRLIRSLLFGVSASDPWTLTGVALVLTAIAVVACFLPARRATKVDPMLALRCE